MESKADRLSFMAIEGAKLGDCGRMCNSCAFRKGSVTQSEPENIDVAYETLAYQGLFHCHTRLEDGTLVDAGKPCAGFLYAKQYLKKELTT